MLYLRRFFVMAVLLVAAGTAQAQIGKDLLRDSPEMLKTFRPVVAKRFRISSASQRKNLFSDRLVSLYNRGEAPSHVRTSPQKVE